MFIGKILQQNPEYSRKSILFGPGNGAGVIFLQIHTTLFWCQVIFSNSLKIGHNACFRVIGLKSSVDYLQFPRVFIEPWNVLG